MLTKGEIQNIDFNTNSCNIRLPLFETVGDSTKAFATAYFAITPGCYNSYKIGDVVIVGFDRDLVDKPYIIGKLYTGLNDEQAVNDGFRGAINCESLAVKNTVILPETTQIVKNVLVLDSTDDKNNITTLANLINTAKDNSNKIVDINNKLDTYQPINDNISAISALNTEGYLKRATDGTWSLIPGSSASDYISKFGDTMLGTLKLANTDNALELPNNAMIKTSINDGLRTVYGYDANTNTFIISSQYAKTNIRGIDTRPTYNGAELALKSDTGISPNLITTGTFNSDGYFNLDLSQIQLSDGLYFFTYGNVQTFVWLTAQMIAASGRYPIRAPIAVIYNENGSAQPGFLRMSLTASTSLQIKVANEAHTVFPDYEMKIYRAL